jgi:GDPmannose 4,6-dehydratase
MRYAFITGITGQDGSYLAEFLLEKHYQVYGIMRRSSYPNTKRIDHLFEHSNLHLEYGDLSDLASIIAILYKIKANIDTDKTHRDEDSRLEIYNLAAQSHVQISFKQPIYTSQINAIGLLNILEGVRICDMIDTTRIYQASTSELYGDVLEVPQNEDTPFNPQSPYAIGKLFSYMIGKNYRQSHKMFFVNGVLFNHESPRRGINFVTRKISRGIGEILSKKISHITVGNIYAKRDWGHAKEYVRSMYLMLQQDEPDDFVIGTGEMHTVKEFIEEAFKVIDINIKWTGEGLLEVGYNEEDETQILVRINPKYFRPCEVNQLLSDPTKAKKKLGWEPTILFKDLVKEMVLYDLEYHDL